MRKENDLLSSNPPSSYDGAQAVYHSADYGFRLDLDLVVPNKP